MRDPRRDEEETIPREAVFSHPTGREPMNAKDRRRLAGEIARYQRSLREVFDHGSPDERLHPGFVVSIEGDGASG